MVVGARVPSDGIVKGNDVIAWVELRVADGSWRELPRASYMSFRAPKEDDPPNDPVVVPPEPDPTPEPQPSPSPSPEPDPQDDPADEQEQVAASRSWQWLLWLLVPAAVGALPAYKLVRRVRRRRTARVSLRYAGAWQELVDTARDLGLAVPTGRSRPAQAVVLGEGSLDLARTADDAVFGPLTPTRGLRGLLLARRPRASFRTSAPACPGGGAGSPRSAWRHCAGPDHRFVCGSMRLPSAPIADESRAVGDGEVEVGVGEGLVLQRVVPPLARVRS